MNAINFHHNGSLELNNCDVLIDKLIRDYDDTAFPLPDIETEPHLLISKVRKHYMEYIIKLLSINYENNQKLLNKNIYLPSAIWRCAKLIETNAAQTCMVVQLYRKNIISVIKELKNDTNKGKLNKKLYECLRNPPENDKKCQTSFGKSNCDCQCTCNLRKKRGKPSESLPITCNNNRKSLDTALSTANVNNCQPIFNIPVIENLQTDKPQMAKDFYFTNQTMSDTNSGAVLNSSNVSTLKPCTRLSVESQDSDGLMLQLEKLFQGDSQEDDLFEGGFGDTYDSSTQFDPMKNSSNDIQTSGQIQDSVIEDHAAQIKSLDERLASLAGLLVNNNNESTNVPQEKAEYSKNKKHNSSKWICEEYFLKSKLYEVLDEIGDSNRKKLARVKDLLVNLFGEDSDDEGVMSPLEETPEFVISCKERIAPWVVKLLTPYYIKGRIKGKSLFKAVAKHLIKLIYQCSRYPHQYEVHSFVSDFLENHKVIRCEADFMQFKIDNI